VNLFAATAALTSVTAAQAPAAEASGLSINLFWIIVAGLNFVVFLVLIWRFAFDPISRILAERKGRIDQGLADAEQAQVDRAAGAADRDRLMLDARKEAAALIAAAQKSAEELRDSDIAATRAELQKLREHAAAEIAGERDRAMADLRAQVADLALAAAGKVVSETMNEPRQRRLVEEFLHEKRVGGEGRTN
jgi:F-type H+-transporting ATPase subunit b